MPGSSRTRANSLFAMKLRALRSEPALLAAAVLLFAAQEVAITSLAPDGDWDWLRRGVFLATTGMMIVVALSFRRFLGAWLVALGIAMNFAPMVAHGGNMPVAYEVVRDSGAFPEISEADIGGQLHNSKDVLLWKEDVRLFALSDRLTATLPGYRTNIYSPGDVVIAAGVLVAVTEVIAQALGYGPLLPVRRRPQPAIG